MLSFSQQSTCFHILRIANIRSFHRTCPPNIEMAARTTLVSSPQSAQPQNLPFWDEGARKRPFRSSAAYLSLPTSARHRRVVRMVEHSGRLQTVVYYHFQRLACSPYPNSRVSLGPIQATLAIAVMLTPRPELCNRITIGQPY